MPNQALPIANIVRVDIITETDSPTVYTGTTANQATCEAIIDEGSRTPLRVKNTILAQNNFDDLVLGYSPTLTEVTLRPEVLALTDGGTAGTGPLFSYAGPQMGYPVNRIPTTIDIWSEEKDGDGATASYMRFRFQHAKGKPVGFSFQDGFLSGMRPLIG